MSTFAHTLGDQLPETIAQPQTVAKPDADLAKLLQAALESPLDYPPLADAIFPGDRVAIAVHPDVPSGQQVIQHVIEYLLARGIEPNDMTLVTAQRMKFQMPGHLSAEETKFNFAVHDMNDEQSVSYLAANQAGQPIKINRCLFDADVIIPITCRDHPASFNDIYPEFSHAETIQRYQQATNSLAERNGEIRLANEHLGVFISLNIVGGPGGEVRAVLFGQKEPCDFAAEEMVHQIWSVEPQQPVPLVIATMEDAPENQTWQQFCLALVAANDVSDGDGQIVICSELADQPVDDIRNVLMMPFEVDQERVGDKLGKGSELMQRVVRILMDRQVFLKSNLSDSVVEELGLGPIAGPDEFRRLVARADRGILLRDAHKVKIRED